MRYIVGVDGGGTKTVAVLCNEDGIILKKVIGKSTNPESIGRKRAYRNLLNILHRIIPQKVDILCVGLAGVDTPQQEQEVKKMLCSKNIAEKIIVVNDSDVALAATTKLKQGIAVIAGTGSTILGKNADGKRVRSSGWGHLVGDEGSAYYIVKEAVIASLKSYDGRGEKTQLENILSDFFGYSSIVDLMLWMYSKKFRKDILASACKKVIEASKYDTVAKKIILDAVSELVISTKAVIEKLNLKNKKITIGLFGGVFKSNIIFSLYKRRIKKLYPKAEIKISPHNPVIGALFIGLDAMGIKINNKILKNM